MRFGGGGTGPRATATHLVVLYDPSDNRVVHLHQVVVLEGGETVSREDAERHAVDQARLLGHDPERLTGLHLDTPLPDEPGVLHVGAGGRLVAIWPDAQR
ncbi:hypothetical protein [Actinoalloteichus caeruleus]|uniref:hypothetical protein n=1 Tax=Actinoalloteichus cyanogriseus TaxID=2893586 RepID=UPI003AAEEB9D